MRHAQAQLTLHVVWAIACLHVRLSSQQTEVVVIPCAQVRGQWPETLCPYTRSAIKHDNLYMGLLASLMFTHPPSVRTMHARRISP